MRKPGTDEDNVQMSDVLCDFCHREWTEDLPMVEGHQGAVICGNCLTIAYDEVVNRSEGTDEPYTCVLCREGPEDRAAMDRVGEPGWLSPVSDGAAACRRCLKRSAGVLHTDPDWSWRKPKT
jgi:hypothetical protein